MLAIRAHTRSPLEVNSCGPVWIPYMESAVSSIAVVDEPAMPRASIGTIAPLVVALFEASDIAMPSIAPSP